MSLTKRLEAVEAALATKSGETGCWCVMLLDGETEEEARARVERAGWPGPFIFLSEQDWAI